jgi:hypothetical protein
MHNVYHKDLGTGVVVENNNGKATVKFNDSGITKTVNESELSQVIND